MRTTRMMRNKNGRPNPTNWPRLWRRLLAMAGAVSSTQAFSSPIIATRRPREEPNTLSTTTSRWWHSYYHDSILAVSSSPPSNRRNQMRRQRMAHEPDRSIQQDDDDDDDDDNCQMDSMRVGICGAGAIGLAMSALLSRAGHDPMMWSPSLSSLQTQQGMEDDPTTKWTASGAFDDDDDDHDSSSTTSFSCRVAATLHDLVRDNEIIVVALPANGHKVVLDRLVPLLRPGRHAVLISSQASLGALYLSTELQHYFQSQQPQQDNNDNDDDESKSIPIAAWATTVCTARQTSPTAVHIHTIRKRVDYCILPRRTTNDDDWSRIQQQQQQQQMQALQSQLFPQVDHFRARSNLFAISLANLNPQNHLAIALGNMSRMEKGETWYQLQHVTPKLGQFLEALDRERLDIAQALLDPDDYSQLKTLRQHFQQGFLGQQSFDEEEDDGGDDNGSISDLMQQIYEHGKDVHGPNTADTRYVTEDVPFGLALTVALGNLVQRPATLHKAGMQIMSAMYERDFASENDLLASLGLLDSSSSCRLEELREGVMETGYLGRPAVAVLEEEEGCEDMAHDAAMMASTMMTMTSETIF
mmetsp:Transcript_15781/g.43518  ORF Transcript_15781/g.43518 Transcript_15781/m.43518 type:complete len:585 (+) Transcript_15781:215-1969(+)